VATLLGGRFVLVIFIKNKAGLPAPRIRILDLQPTLAHIRVFFDDLHSMAFGIFPDNVHLVAGERLLVLCRHPHVSGTMSGGQVCVAGTHEKQNWLPRVPTAKSRLFSSQVVKWTPPMGRLLSLKHDSETIFICVDTFARVGFQGNT
jgi:hypothetical protein